MCWSRILAPSLEEENIRIFLIYKFVDFLSQTLSQNGSRVRCNLFFRRVDIDQSWASIQVTWSVSTNQRTAFGKWNIKLVFGTSHQRHWHFYSKLYKIDIFTMWAENSNSKFKRFFALRDNWCWVHSPQYIMMGCPWRMKMSNELSLPFVVYNIVLVFWVRPCTMVGHVECLDGNCEELGFSFYEERFSLS